MIHTPVGDLPGIEHPIVLGGMATGTSVPLVVAVSNAGALGTLGLAGLIDSVAPAADVVMRMMKEAENVLRNRLPAALNGKSSPGSP